MRTKPSEPQGDEDQPVILELKAIKRLLALLLLRDGAGQQQVARAAGVAKLAINQLANVGMANKKKQNGRAPKE